MAIYVTEDELREEIFNIQQSNKLRILTDLINKVPTDTLLIKYQANKITTFLETYGSLSDDALILEINKLTDAGVICNYSKEKFGKMVLLVVQQLSKKGNFAGYTWHEDFYSNAIEKILSYAVNNVDLDMISKRSGLRTKIFAYITQIASNAFIEVINERNQEHADMMEHIIPFEDFYNHVKKLYNPVYDDKPEDREQPEVRISFTVDPEDNCILVDNGVELRLWDQSVYGVLKQYRETTDKIEIVYPDTLKISLEDLALIDTLEYKFLNVNKFSKEKYKPSFPKKEKQEKINKFEGWE